MGKKRITVTLPVTSSDVDCPVKVVNDSGVFWFCLEDLHKHLGSAVDDACEKLDIPDELIKHFQSRTVGGYNKRLYIHQGALYRVLCCSEEYDFDEGADLFTSLMLAAADFYYGATVGVPIHVEGILQYLKREAATITDKPTKEGGAQQ